LTVSCGILDLDFVFFPTFPLFFFFSPFLFPLCHPEQKEETFPSRPRARTRARLDDQQLGASLLQRALLSFFSPPIFSFPFLSFRGYRRKSRGRTRPGSWPPPSAAATTPSPLFFFLLPPPPFLFPPPSRKEQEKNASRLPSCLTRVDFRRPSRDRGLPCYSHLSSSSHFSLSSPFFLLSWIGTADRGGGCARSRRKYRRIAVLVWSFLSLPFSSFFFFFPFFLSQISSRRRITSFAGLVDRRPGLFPSSLLFSFFPSSSF